MRIDKLKINEDIYKLGNDAIIEGYYRRYPTLSTPPTLQTLTYTLDGETLTYDIGAVVRVEDADSPTGYSFYRLHDITELGSAIWSKLGNGLLGLYETLTVDIVSNQGAVDQNLIGVQVVIKYGNTLLTQTYSGEPMLFYIPAGSTYSIYAVNNVPAGYGTNYSSSNYTAVSWGARRLEVVCGMETVSITVDGYPVQHSGTEVYVYHYGGSNSNPYLYDASIIIDGLYYHLKNKMNSSTNTINVPLNSTYTIYIPPFYGRNAQKFVSSSGQYTATNASRVVNVTTQDLNDGVYILRNDCIFYEPDDWDTDWNDEAVGVALIYLADQSLFESFLIKKDDVSLGCTFDSLVENRIGGEDLIPEYYDSRSYSARPGYAEEAIALEYSYHDYPYVNFFTDTSYQGGKYRPTEKYTIFDCIDILNNDPTARFAVELNSMSDGNNVSNTNWDARVYQGYEAIRNCSLKNVSIVDDVMYGIPRYLLAGGFISNTSPYIGTMAQWQYIFDNESAVDDAMSLIGGNEIYRVFSDSLYLWSMTPVYNHTDYMWCANYIRGSVHNYDDYTQKTNYTIYVRPFYSLTD